VHVAALIVAAGRGTRMAGRQYVPKQYQILAGRPVLAWVVDAFARHAGIHAIQVVIHPDDRSLYDTVFHDPPQQLRDPVAGGATRQESVLAGLRALNAIAPDVVLIHDAARPLLTPGDISNVLAGLAVNDGIIAAMPVSDTLKRVDADGLITGTVAREGIWRAQTPQGFRFARLLAAHEAAAAVGRSDFTDDAAIAEWAAIAVKVVEGSARNIKLTRPEDFAMAELLIADAQGAGETRTGTGFDVHRFKEGDHVWLCGVRVPHTHGLAGHSDADVALHAVTDALLGTIAEADIGHHFPPDDPRWAGAPSHQFVREACRRIAARAGRILNVDITLLCEAPRIGPHREAMRAAVAEMLGVGIDRVSVKATTTEGLGFTGRREGIAAMASAAVVVPCQVKKSSDV
jgi:2-C-methyl-D-erythritol 4-phosphate cytidylyltransferase/2-C-methyl-D-erythritol 2,4-cyclodiphosphate synthase